MSSQRFGEHTSKQVPGLKSSYLSIDHFWKEGDISSWFHTIPASYQFHKWLESINHYISYLNKGVVNDSILKNKYVQWLLCIKKSKLQQSIQNEWLRRSWQRNSRRFRKKRLFLFLISYSWCYQHFQVEIGKLHEWTNTQDSSVRHAGGDL